MDLKFQQSEGIAARRRWILVLVQDADATAGLTGATGQVYISKNGGTPALSTNSLVEVDSTNMPGHYYVELTAAELDTLGWISIVKKTAASKAFHDRGFVSYDDPAARHGGFAIEGRNGVGSKSGGISKVQAKALLDDIRTIVQEELAKEEVEDTQEIQEQKDYTEKLDAILAAVSREPETIDFSPILMAISSIKPAKDYGPELAKIAVQINAFGNAHNLDVAGFAAAIKGFQDNMSQGANSVTSALSGLQFLVEGFTKLQKLMEDYGASLAAQTDMDVRFAKLDSKAKDDTMQKISDQLQKLTKAMEFVLRNIK